MRRLPRMPARAATPAVTEQLVFDLATPEPPSFRNFLPGGNAEALAVLKALAAGEAGETGVMLWGAPGAGKTHLLRAAVAAVEARGRRALFVAAATELVGYETDLLTGQDVVAIDDIDRADPDAQARLFTLFNGLREQGRHLIVASRMPLSTLSLREDLRTRLGWGLVYEVTPLADADKPAALAAYARGRGFALSDDVVQYLLAHGRRDMAALVNVLTALDRYSLSTKRPITVPLLRGWFQRDIDLGS